MHGWPLAPFGTKAGTDANHKAMLEFALRPEHEARWPSAWPATTSSTWPGPICWPTPAAWSRRSPSRCSRAWRRLRHGPCERPRGRPALHARGGAGGLRSRAGLPLPPSRGECRGRELHRRPRRTLRRGCLRARADRFATAVARRNEVRASAGRHRLADGSRRRPEIRALRQRARHGSHRPRRPPSARHRPRHRSGRRPARRARRGRHRPGDAHRRRRRGALGEPCRPSSGQFCSSAARRSWLRSDRHW